MSSTVFKLKNIISRPTGILNFDLFQKDVVEALKQIVIKVFTTSLSGLVPAPEESTGRFLRDDATWATSSSSISKNSGAIVGTRAGLNLIEGANITLTVVDDPIDNEVDITIAASGGGGGSLDEILAGAVTL